MRRILAISDIHGHYDELVELLDVAKYKPDDDQLIFVGDYIDRGDKSKNVLELIKGLVENDGAIALKGNHEQMLLDYLEDASPNDFYLIDCGGNETIKSFLGEFSGDHEAIKQAFNEHRELIDFIKGLPIYHETEGHIFVHGGLNPHYTDWKETPPNEMLWIRELFINNPVKTEKKIVFGHTPTINIIGDPAIWFHENKIGIDGGCCFGHQMNCLEITENGHDTYSVKKKIKAVDENNIVKEMRILEWMEAFDLFHERLRVKKEQNKATPQYHRLIIDMIIKEFVNKKLNVINSIIPFNEKDWFFHSTGGIFGSIIIGQQRLKITKNYSEGDILGEINKGKIFVSKEPDYFLDMPVVRNHDLNLPNDMFLFVIDLHGLEYKKIVHYYDLNHEGIQEILINNQLAQLNELLRYEIFPNHVEDDEIIQYLEKNNYHMVFGVETFVEQDIPADRIRGFFYIDEFNVKEFFWHSAGNKLMQIIFN